MKRLASILLVEDSPDDVELILHAFRKLGISNPIQVLGDGEEAIAYLKGTAPFADRERYPLPQLILLDLKLPRRSGLEVLEEAKQDPATKLIPIVVLTSSNQGQDIRNAYDKCANSYLVKPVKRDALIELMRSLDTYWLGHNEMVR